MPLSHILPLITRPKSKLGFQYSHTASDDINVERLIKGQAPFRHFTQVAARAKNILLIHPWPLAVQEERTLKNIDSLLNQLLNQDFKIYLYLSGKFRAYDYDYLNLLKSQPFFILPEEIKKTYSSQYHVPLDHLSVLDHTFFIKVQRPDLDSPERISLKDVYLTRQLKNDDELISYLIKAKQSIRYFVKFYHHEAIEQTEHWLVSQLPAADIRDEQTTFCYFLPNQDSSSKVQKEHYLTLHKDHASPIPKGCNHLNETQFYNLSLLDLRGGGFKKNIPLKPLLTKLRALKVDNTLPFIDLLNRSPNLMELEIADIDIPVGYTFTHPLEELTQLKITRGWMSYDQINDWLKKMPKLKTLTMQQTKLYEAKAADKRQADAEIILNERLSNLQDVILTDLALKGMTLKTPLVHLKTLNLNANNLRSDCLLNALQHTPNLSKLFFNLNKPLHQPVCQDAQERLAQPLDWVPPLTHLEVIKSPIFAHELALLASKGQLKWLSFGHEQSQFTTSFNERFATPFTYPLTKLKTLHFYDGLLDGNQVFKLLTSCRSLNEFKIIGTRLLNGACNTPCPPLPLLQSLFIINGKNQLLHQINPTFLTHLLQSAPLVHKLWLDTSFVVTPELQTICLSKTLNELKLSSANWALLKDLKNPLPSLEILTMVYDNPSFLQAVVENTPNLIQPTFFNVQLADVGVISGWKKLLKLTIIHLTGQFSTPCVFNTLKILVIYNVRTAFLDFKSFIEACPQLEKLGFLNVDTLINDAACYRYLKTPDESAFNRLFLKALTKIESITIAPSMRYQALALIAEKLPNLKKIAFSNQQVQTFRALTDPYFLAQLKNQHYKDRLAAILAAGLSIEQRSKLLSRASHSPQIPARFIDASPASLSEGIRSIKRHFYHASGQHPPVALYRHQVYDTLWINPTPCRASEAFQLQRKQPLNLIMCKDERRIRLVKAEQINDLFNRLTDHFLGRYTLTLSRYTWQPLLSLSPNERITHLCSSEPAIEIAYSKSTRLYYVRHTGQASVETHFAYLVVLNESDNLPIKDDIQQEVTRLQSFSCAPLTKMPEVNTGTEYLAALNREKKGVCRHRAVILKQFMNERYPDWSAYVIINPLHAFLNLISPANIAYTVDCSGSPVELRIEDTMSQAGVDVSDFASVQACTETSRTQTKPSPQKKKEKDLRMDEMSRRQIDEAFPLSLGPSTKKKLHSIKDSINETVGRNHLLKLDGQIGVKNTLLCLLDAARLQKRLAFYVDNAEELRCLGPYIAKKGAYGEYREGPGGKLFNFLQQTKHHTTSPTPWLIVNYANFSAQEVIQAHTLIDDTRSIDTISIPCHINLIGLCDTLNPNQYLNADFTSRFDAIYDVHTPESPLESKPTPPINKENALIIELFNSLQWEAKLLGQWRLDGARLIYQEGALMHAVMKGAQSIILQNPPLNHPSFSTFIDNVRVNKGFYHHHTWVDLADDVSIHYQYGFDFKFLTTHITLNPVPLENAWILNRQQLAKFLGTYECLEGQHELFFNPGLIKAHPKSALNIYLTSPLSLDEWARLLSEAKDFDVQLNLQLAPGVELPKALNLAYEKPTAPIAVDVTDLSLLAEGQTHIIDSEDCDITLSGLHLKNPLVLEVSELEPAQLLFKLHGAYDEALKTFRFTSEKGVLLKALENHHDVILIGQFSQDLADHLAPLLLKRLTAPQANQLFIISHDIKPFYYMPFVCLKSHKARTELKLADLRQRYDEQLISSLPSSTIEQHMCAQLRALLDAKTHLSEQKEPNPWTALVKAPPVKKIPIELENSAQKTKAFFSQRLAMVKKTLSFSPFAILSGLTGTGKSTFVTDIWATQFPYCYFEASQLKDWALDRRPGLKTIFIDEANALDNDLMCFEGLFHKPYGIIIENQFYPLTDEHKVLFAANPLSYGGERHMPRLFLRHGKSCLFEPLPPYVLYERILKPCFKHSSLSEKDIHTVSSFFLGVQSFLNYECNQIMVSPRELITMALLTLQFIKKHKDCDLQQVAQFYARQVVEHNVPKSLQEAFNKAYPKPTIRPHTPRISPSGFVYTRAHQAIGDVIKDLLSLSLTRKSHASSSSNTKMSHYLFGGLNGVILEGEPGIGKSRVLIEALTSSGFKPGKMTKEKGRFYYHLPAAMRYQQKEKMLLHAFHQGSIVILDEANSCAPMERLMNSLLSGLTPDGRRPETPGFMLFCTQNPIQRAGRGKQSPALKRRLLYCHIPEYTPDEMQSILMKLGVDAACCDYLLKRYQKRLLFCEQQGLASPCFRDLLTVAKRLLNAQHPVKRQAIELETSAKRQRVASKQEQGLLPVSAQKRAAIQEDGPLKRTRVEPKPSFFKPKDPAPEKEGAAASSARLEG